MEKKEPMHNQNVLVTGGGGFLGRAVVRKLLEEGARVTSFSRQYYPELCHSRVAQVQGDLADKKAVIQAVSGVDTVFHVAAKAGIWGKRDDFFRANVTGTQHVIQACLDNGVKRLVHTSSPSVVFHGGDMEGVDESVPYPERYHAVYPETKAMAEQMVKKAGAGGLDTIILRPHLIWGPGDTHLVPQLIKRAKTLKKIGSGKNRVDTIYVENAATAHILACKALARNPDLSGNIYFISQDQPVNLWQMVDNILACAGVPPVKGAVSARSAVAAGAVFECFFSLLKIEKEPPMTSFAARELSTSHWFDISRAKKDLGYRPEISIEEGLAMLAASFGSKRRE